MTGKTVPDEDFDGCARECRKARAHTHAWGRCAHAPEPQPPSKDDLRGLLIAAGLVSHTQAMDDGCLSVIVHTDEDAADRALKVFQEWMFGTPEEIAARKAEPLRRDEPTDLCERIAPGQHVASERASIIEGIKDYFAAVDDALYDDVMTLCGRIERGEYSATRGDR